MSLILNPYRYSGVSGADASVLLVIAGASPTADEQDWIDRLALTGRTVDTAEDGASEVTSGYDVVVVSPTAAQVSTKYKGTHMPVVHCYQGVWNTNEYTLSSPGGDAGETGMRLLTNIPMTGQSKDAEVALGTTAATIFYEASNELPQGAHAWFTTASSYLNVCGFVIPAGEYLDDDTQQSNTAVCLGFPSTWIDDADATSAFDQLVEDAIDIAVGGTSVWTFPGWGTPLDILHVVNAGVSAGEPTDADELRFHTRLEQCGHTATAILATDTEVTSGYDVVIVGSTVTAANIGTKYNGDGGLPAVRLGMANNGVGSKLLKSTASAASQTYDGTVKLSSGAAVTFSNGYAAGDRILKGYHLNNRSFSDANDLLADAVPLFEHPTTADEKYAWTLDVGSTLDDSNTTTARVACISTGISADYFESRAWGDVLLWFNDVLNWAVS